MNTFPLTSHLRSSFRKIGADVRAVAPLTPRENWIFAQQSAQRIRVRDDLFELILPPQSLATVLDCRKHEHHLVLSLQVPGSPNQKFLCGFDERHWFAAAVAASNVPAAKDSLMPPVVRAAALRVGVRHSELYRRHNRAFVRQGEWFFLPTDVPVNPLTIHRREPLIRPGGGKPHIVDELVRGAGEMVWHNAKFAPNGLTQDQYALLSRVRQSQPGWSRRLLVRNGSVLARGAVRHSDHATIFLRGWHQVLINSEQRPASLGFLD